ncbi:MAG: hypothetical protein ABEH65_04950 [Halobacteriales archaeon]
MRRTVLAVGIFLVGVLVAGCLGGSGAGDGPDHNQTESESEEQSTDDDVTTPSLGSTFEILDVTSTGTTDGSASVTFENQTIIVTGTILGSNSCYTARLGTVTIENGTLLVRIESYEDADENKGCREVIIGINYEVNIEINGDPPSAVTVDHNDEHVTTEQLS